MKLKGLRHIKYSKGNKIVFELRMDRKLRNRLKQVAYGNRLTMNHYINMLVKDAVEVWEKRLKKYKKKLLERKKSQEGLT